MELRSRKNQLKINMKNQFKYKKDIRKKKENKNQVHLNLFLAYITIFLFEAARPICLCVCFTPKGQAR